MVAGATAGSMATLRGPIRHSYSGAMVTRQLSAATFRSGALSSVMTSFSASANVEGETSGPTAADVPNAGGAPAGGSPAFGVAGVSLDLCVLPQDAKATPTRPSDV